MKVTLLCKSDSTGGAAIVTRRLMEALRREHVDARMLVVEKLTDSSDIEVCASPLHIKEKFLAERLSIFFANGFDRKDLFKVDAGNYGLPVYDHPWVKDADAIILHWVNQGMVSLNGVRELMQTGKPLIWTMHDMWCMTGICHHAGTCRHYEAECGECPLLGKRAARHDLSHKVWKRKSELYGSASRYCNKPAFVAVSNWVKEKALCSSLLKESDVRVIGNPLVLPYDYKRRDSSRQDHKIKILFGAARLDDPIKGFPELILMLSILKYERPELAGRLELITFGTIRDASLFNIIEISHRHIGKVEGEENLRKLYESADMVVSASDYETFALTLLEGQAYGCIPVSFNRGGQNDIITHKSDGYLAVRTNDDHESAKALADGVVWAAGIIDDESKREEIIQRMADNAAQRFYEGVIARKYIDLIHEMSDK